MFTNKIVNETKKFNTRVVSSLEEDNREIIGDRLNVRLKLFKSQYLQSSTISFSKLSKEINVFMCKVTQIDRHFNVIVTNTLSFLTEISRHKSYISDSSA